MSATLKQLRDQIIIDAGIEGHPKFPTARLNRMINQAQRYIQTELNGLGMKKWETKKSVTSLTGDGFGVVGSSNTVTFDIADEASDMVESPHSIIYMAGKSTAGDNGMIEEVDQREFWEQLNNTYLAPTWVSSSNTNKGIWTRLGGTIYIAPTDVSAVDIVYYKVVTDLSSDSSTTEIPSEFEQHIVKKVVIDVDAVLGNMNDKVEATRQLEKDLATAYQKFNGKSYERNRTQIEQKQRLQ